MSYLPPAEEAASAVFDRWTTGEMPRWESMLPELRSLKTSKTPPPAARDGERQIVDFDKNAPPFSPEKTALLPPLKTEFADAEHWDGLAEKYLERYVLPAWDRYATSGDLQLWIERMDLPVKSFLRTGAYRDLGEAISLNPRWPLRALIGLALEVRHEIESQ